MIPEIKTVCFVGAGTMGCYNSLISALAGYQVIIFDRDEFSLNQVKQRQQAIAAELINHQGISASSLEKAMSRVNTERDLAAALADADLISESIFEELEVKREVLGQLDEQCHPHAILTSNTSNLLVSNIESNVIKGERFAALHSYLGAPLIDIVGGAKTTEQTIDTLKRYVESLGCMPMILKKEYPGYVLNALLAPVLGASLSMVVKGVADPLLIDKAWMHFMKATMGPYGMMDLFGLNLIRDSWLHKKVGEDQLLLKDQVLELLNPMVESGQLGIKTGSGFYQYPTPEYADKTFIEGAESLEAIFNIMLAALVGHACKIALNEVASIEDIEKCWQVGARLKIGPFSLVKEKGVVGIINVLTQMESVSSMHTPEEFKEIIKFLETNNF